ncbi:MAG: V-type ATPase subunit [Eubacteriales bacterium]|nr:V-type ATPase subunit [Eubacteriales bacterium]
MGSVLSYSGLSTKIRAMQSRLTTDEQLREILQLPNVPQVAAYLKRTPEYMTAWAGLDENDLHRGQMEKLLKKSIFRNFSRIYHFANQEQRKFLELYAKRYEILVLKELMTNLFDHRTTDPMDLSPYHDFFLQHSHLDLDPLLAARNMDEFLGALRSNEFYSPLSRVHGHEGSLLFDYGMALDLYYFSQIWNVRKKLFQGNDLKEITKAYGEKFDMLNLEFLLRSKRYYHMEPAKIYSLLIPVNYKLKKEEITALAEASTSEEYRSVFLKTYYGRKYQTLNAATLEEFYNYLLRSILEKEARKDPYSVAVIYSYLYHKEHEVNRLTIALECVRYGVSQDEAMRYIRSN